MERAYAITSMWWIWQVGHVKAIQKLEEEPKVRIYNLGTGHGYSVLEVLHAFEKACGKTLPYEIKPRRAGDIATCYCAPGEGKERAWLGGRVGHR